MKKVLCTSAASFLMASLVNAAVITPGGYNEVFVDTIDPTQYGADQSSIDGYNGWSNPGGEVILRTPYDGSRFNAETLDSLDEATRSASVNAGDNALRIATFSRYKEEGNRTQRISLTSGGTELLSFGSGQGTANLITGAGLSFTPSANTLSTEGHVFYYFEIEYDEMTGAGTVWGNTRASSADYTETAALSFGTFTGAIDVDSIDGISYATSDNSGFLEQVGISTVAVPEPATLGLLSLAFGALAMLRRRRK